jgi:hypothetical protein
MVEVLMFLSFGYVKKFDGYGADHNKPYQQLEMVGYFNTVGGFLFSFIRYSNRTVIPPIGVKLRYDDITKPKLFIKVNACGLTWKCRCTTSIITSITTILLSNSYKTTNFAFTKRPPDLISQTGR